MKSSYLPIITLLSIVGLRYNSICVNAANADQARPSTRFKLQSPPGEPDAKRNSNLFRVVNEWKYIDFEYPTFVERQLAIKNG